MPELFFFQKVLACSRVDKISYNYDQNKYKRELFNLEKINYENNSLK